MFRAGMFRPDKARRGLEVAGCGYHGKYPSSETLPDFIVVFKAPSIVEPGNLHESYKTVTFHESGHLINDSQKRND